MENKDKELTKSDKSNLKHCPDGWFEEMDVWPRVRRTHYSLGRLVDAGVLEYNYDTKRYRKIK